MNIFVLDESPEEAARMQCDKHVVKMILESAQMLCSLWPDGKAPYKRAFFNHPCTKWVRKSAHNHFWLLQHANALCREYTRRYGKVHKTQEVIEWCDRNDPPWQDLGHPLDPWTGLTPFAQAMPDQYKVEDDAVQAYRNYYIGDKARFAKWKEPSLVPEWFSEAACLA